MSKLYVFAIGGTGSRVLRSLTMLLAAGVKLGADEVVPIIIDPDGSNADLTRTVTLMNSYRQVRSSLSFANDNPCQFFRTELRQLLPNFSLHVRDTSDRPFKQFIGYASMSRANKAVTKMLFSDDNLEAKMDVGFRGNPNIGSVVLNQIASSDHFQAFNTSFSNGDRIFIVSSIFGGTGASGFPLLLKTLRSGANGLGNGNLIRNAQIGALTVLPYFKLNADENSEIDSSTFITKAKSALAYYEANIANNNMVNALYYLADDMANTYDNHDGGEAQQNAAHLIELLGATAIVDFSNRQLTATSHMELGIRDGQQSVSFGSFYDKLRDMLYKPMVQFTLMANALIDSFSTFSASSFAANKGNFDNLYSSAFFRELLDFLGMYKEWNAEAKGNKRPLDLFSLNCGKRPFELVTDVKPKRILSRYSDYALVIDRLNTAIKKCNRSSGKETLFLEMFYRATEKLVSEKLSN